MRPTLVRVLACLALSRSASAIAEPITVTDAWARATPPGATNAAAYFTISSASREDRLLGATSPAASEVQLHTHVTVDGASQMRRLAEIALPADGHVVLEPGGQHVMLLGIKAPLKPGERVAITLRFAAAPDLELLVPVLDARTMAQH